MPPRSRGGFAGLAMSLLQAAGPTGADAALGRDLGGREAGVAVGERALARVGGTSSHGMALWSGGPARSTHPSTGRHAFKEIARFRFPADESPMREAGSAASHFFTVRLLTFSR